MKVDLAPSPCGLSSLYGQSANSTLGTYDSDAEVHQGTTCSKVYHVSQKYIRGSQSAWPITRNSLITPEKQSAVKLQ